jgi:hypothetical protein
MHREEGVKERVEEKNDNSILVKNRFQRRGKNNLR